MYPAGLTSLYDNNPHSCGGRQATESRLHSVHFYEDDGLFLDSLGEFVGAALGAGGACVVIATGSHRAGLTERLKAHGIDVPYIMAMNRLISLDADEVLSRFMLDGSPDGQRFHAAVEPELQRARKALRGKSTSVVAFGEMVALLWKDGRYEAAIELERLWGVLAERHAFSLRCAYPLGLFTDQAQYDLFRRVCTAHHQVIPAESYTSLDNQNDRYRMISSRQQKAWTMQAVMKGREEEIRHLQQVESELRTAQQAAIELERQAGAGRMAATIAHEINNPLEAVTNFIFLALAAEGLPEDAARHLQMADRELARAAQITRQMLGFYRGASKPRWIPVSALIHDVVSMFSRKLRNKQLSTSISIDPALEVYGKDGELRQVLLNLTANAADASHHGGRLWFRAHRTSNWNGQGRGVRITIADNGTGMSPEVQRRIFVPFFTTKAGTGTGIGLWVTKCLIEQQGGYLHFRSTQGPRSGTVMTLFLPLARTSSEPIAEVA